jgi:hypothetical protein
VPAYGPHWTGPGVLEEVLQELVGGLGQVLVDGVEVHCLLLARLGGDGGGGGELLLQAKHHSAHVTGVKSGNDRFGAVRCLGREDVGGLKDVADSELML